MVAEMLHQLVIDLLSTPRAVSPPALHPRTSRQDVPLVVATISSFAAHAIATHPAPQHRIRPPFYHGNYERDTSSCLGPTELLASAVASNGFQYQVIRTALCNQVHVV